MNNTELIARLKQTNQFAPNADVTTEEIVAALEAAQPAGKPVAWVLWNTRDEEPVMLYTAEKPEGDFKNHLELRPVYFTGYMPQPAPQEPMTEDEIENACRDHSWSLVVDFDEAYRLGVADTEAHHKIGVKP